MEIIRKGELKNYLFTCHECWCQWIANSSEVLGYKTVLMESYPVMFCPCCKKKECAGDEKTEEELEELRKKYELEAEEDDHE